MAQVNEAIEAVRDAFTVKRVFGDPIEKDGLTVIPVAAVGGGGGGGSGTAAEKPGEEGTGVGFGGSARPVGVYVVRADGVEWQPALDVSRLGMAGIALVALALLTIRAIFRR